MQNFQNFLNQVIFKIKNEIICIFPERSRSIVIQGKVARQIRLYSAGIAFALVYNLLPINKLNGKLYGIVSEQFAKRAEKARRFGLIF